MKKFMMDNLGYIIKILAVGIGFTLCCVGVTKLSILMMFWGFILAWLGMNLEFEDNDSDKKGE